MTLVWYACRASRRQMWRTTLLVMIIGGLLGTVALGALAAARRTDSAYGRYLRSVNASDVMVDVPGPFLPLIKAIEHAPGTVSSAAWIGVAANPVIDGKVDDAFLTNSLTGTLDGEFYRQDKVTVVAGTMPPPNSTGEIVLTQSMADAFRRQGVQFRVGDRMTWQLYWQAPASEAPQPAGRATFRIAGIVTVPPALGDQFDDTASAFLTPAATQQILAFPQSKGYEWAFGWATLRLRDGDAGVPALRHWLSNLARAVASRERITAFQFTIRRLAVVKQAAQQAIKPQALALAVLGALAALALIILMAQGLAQMLSRPAADALTLRALGASRPKAAGTAAGWGAVAVVGAVVLSIAGAIAVSPLAPVGPVRNLDPARGFEADWLVLGGGGAVLLLILGVQLAWLAWRAVRQGRELPPAQASGLVAALSRAALPVTTVTGIRHALERGTGRLRAPVLATLAGSIVAVTALIGALVFGASLNGLTTHPERYGWNWTLLVQGSGGWGSWPTGHLDPFDNPQLIAGRPSQLVTGQPGLLGWSELGFGQLTIDRTEVPVMGILSHPGRPVEPPTTSGHPLTGQNQIEFGDVTLRQLGLHIGERIKLGYDPVPVTVVGTATLPSFGVVLTDHVSLGRGAMMDEATLLSILRFPLDPSSSQYESAVATPAYPATIIFDLSSRHDAQALASRIIRWANSTPENAGSVYTLAPQLGAPVRNASQMGSQPLTFAIGVAAAAVLALALTILTSVRERRRDLALLKALGLRSSQLRAVVGWQTTTILVIAAAVGVPLGIAVGNWAWTTFANSIGVVPLPVVPVSALLAGIAALLVAGNLLALWPAQLAARVAPAAAFRIE
ncbi:MAG TPA: ABC transporter permease [Streptosporangiaceae bacterium]|nr:ABC transporter permease [Streptosporangiaceae bacterium]